MEFNRNFEIERLDNSSIFELAPVSLWLEDASAVKALFETWQARGMVSLREYLKQPESLTLCLSKLNVIKVNRKTLDLFEASDFSEFFAAIPRILKAQSLEGIIDQWVELWDGKTSFFGQTVNTTLSGRDLNVQIRGHVLPGHERDWSRVLIAIEDVTALEQARRTANDVARYAQGLFENSPVALWVKDFSAVKCLLDKARDKGVLDLRAYFEHNSAFKN
ncbi:hypothetical protein LAV84_30275 [Rhizobium sp. VS19-DR104.2]|uniref:hypothetical protein n=1 Tax=unclassified Rhizobium TaxID=2613769 RepID=UPI001CC3F87D|nr:MULTISPECIES: hypothetical protein [unclassified Rhizobium]MBZ5763734.1 hypothetical protein [Rhizobium sp. VS19-DR96]MBZ5769668.1 hypothetical protein [Rhizobium sp. VS19-DR129.2]MBZ5777201.1 hypothetical protein [Rhizobium sp. VS19-DRK62.2]MBZ5788347.1 hypothetical protein [Rhizobium sp. VS19-DR121]MBZ5805794.1 hypothetical protein [Rhizobium sp. VS19-DR181]